MNRAAREALLIVLLGSAAGFGTNALRARPLPLAGPLGEPSVAEAGADLAASDAAVALSAWEEGAFFLDIRSTPDFETRRVAGALPLPADSLEDAYFNGVANLGVDMPVVVYGAGPDSFAVRRVAQYLLDVGHADVSVAVCGLDALVAAGIDPGDGPVSEVW